MRANFKFHPVGQGCFYTGVIPYDDKEFVIVYDCGSVTSGTYLGDAIADFRKNHDYIDLLVVSHLDQDHFNGIQQLIDKISVGRIILPYLSLAERLAIVATTKGVSKLFMSFMKNPVAYLRSSGFEIVTISFIEAAPNKEDGSEADEASRNAETKERIFINEEESFRGFEENENFRLRVEEDDEQLLEGPNVSFLPFNTSAIIYNKKLGKDIWEFIFYHRKVASATAIEDFQRAVNTHLSKNGISTSYDLFDKGNLKDLKKYYPNYLHLTVNRSSVCLYHGALISTRFWVNFFRYPTVIGKKDYYYYFDIPRSGTLLTGDQELKTNTDFNAFCNYYNKQLVNVEVFQVPHHGGNPNWNRMPNMLNNYDIGCYVINHGLGRKSHPHINVLDNLKDNISSVIILNNEYSEFDYIIDKV